MKRVGPRTGPRPTTSTKGPHRQLDDRSSPELWGRLVAELFAMSGVVEGHSQVSLPSTRALYLREGPESVDARASLAPDGARPEPVHVHGVDDTSLHLCLPSELAQHVCDMGWGEPHGFAEFDTEIMVYGPRDTDELAVVIDMVARSLQYARTGK